MTPNQPYLLRAFYDWIVDNNLTPYMVVDVLFKDVFVPTQYVNDGQIVLNVSPNACVNFSMDNETVKFQARFSGQPMLVSFPCHAVGAIYAKENGAGTVFSSPDIPLPPQDDNPPEPPTSNDETPNSKAGKPSLRVIK